MTCNSIVSPKQRANIILVEKYIRKVSEARILELELKVLEALNSGLKLTDLDITERITWTDSLLKFKYSCKVCKK